MLFFLAVFIRLLLLVFLAFVGLNAFRSGETTAGLWDVGWGIGGNGRHPSDHPDLRGGIPA